MTANIRMYFVTKNGVCCTIACFRFLTMPAEGGFDRALGFHRDGRGSNLAGENKYQCTTVSQDLCFCHSTSIKQYSHATRNLVGK